MDKIQERSRDLASVVVPAVGRLVESSDPWEPYRLVDLTGAPVDAVGAFLRDLQAAGRTAATARSYGMDLLRWFRFLWAVDVAWDRATRGEADLAALCRLDELGLKVTGATQRLESGRAIGVQGHPGADRDERWGRDCG